MVGHVVAMCLLVRLVLSWSMTLSESHDYILFRNSRYSRLLFLLFVAYWCLHYCRVSSYVICWSL